MNKAGHDVAVEALPLPRDINDLRTWRRGLGHRGFGRFEGGRLCGRRPGCGRWFWHGSAINASDQKNREKRSCCQTADTKIVRMFHKESHCSSPCIICSYYETLFIQG